MSLGMLGSVLISDGVMGSGTDAKIMISGLWLRRWKAYFSWRFQKIKNASQTARVEKQKPTPHLFKCDVYHAKSWALSEKQSAY